MSETGGHLDADVAIVGAGPVGLVLGIQLAQRGRSVVILEQWPTPYPLPRAVHFDHEVGRIIQSCGIGDAVRAVAEPAEVYEWQNGDGTTLLRFGRVGLAMSGWPFSSMFCQPDLEALLEEQVAALPTLELRRGVRVRALEQRPDHVAITMDPTGIDPAPARTRMDDDSTVVHAAYVVGCDGANSTVRQLLDIGLDDRGFFYDWLIVDVLLHEPRVFDPPNLQVCDPARPTTAVSGGPGRRRWEFMRLPGETIDELNRPERAWELLAPWGVTPAEARLERHAVYTFQARVAERWRDDRVMLAGDAAHQMPPFAGQGMCTGIRDAVNLAWKLDLVLTGRANPIVLDTYDEERRPSASAAVDFSIELGKVICVADADEAAARDEAMTATYDGGVSPAPAAPGLSGGIVSTDGGHAGELFPQGTLDGELFDDVYGAGFRLVTVGGDVDGLDGELIDWFAGIGGTVVDVTDSSADLGEWFRARGIRWALQRPDFHLFGTAATIAGARHLLIDLRHRLAAA